MPDSLTFRHLKRGAPCKSILLVKERHTSCTSYCWQWKHIHPAHCTSILLAVEMVTPCMSILLAMGSDTPCKSILMVERNTPCMSILLAAELGYTLQVHTAGSASRYNLHVHRQLQMLLFLLYYIEKSYVCRNAG